MMRALAAVLITLFFFTPALSAYYVEREVSAAHSSENSRQGLGLQVCGWLTVTAYGPPGTVGAARCGNLSAVCTTDDTGQCTNRIYNGGDGMRNNMPYCWVGTTTAGAGFASCQWDSDTAPPPTE